MSTIRSNTLHAYKRLLIAGTSTLALGVISVQAAWAQDENSEEKDSIVVTGTRVPRANLVSNSPLTTLDAERFQLDADTNVVRQLQLLPSFTPGRAPNSGEGTAFTGSFVDLRALDRKRTLVLVDGQRWINAISDGGVDVSTIPPELIERVDVITGGASATYGSDAVAGVVNFILKKDFDGIEFNIQSGITEKGEAIGTRVSVTGGTEFSDGRGSSYYHVSWDQTENITSNGRSFLDPVVVNSGGELVPLASQATYTGTAEVDGVIGKFVNGELFSSPGVVNNLQDDEYWNAGSLARLQYPQDKLQIAAGLKYNLNDNVEFFADGTYIREEILVTVDSRGLFLEGYQIPVDNPFVGPLTKDYFATLDDDMDGYVSVPGLARRLTELGQQRHNDRNTYRVAGGFRVDLGEGYNLETFASYSETVNDIRLKGFPDLDRLEQALDVVDGPNGLQCRIPDYNRVRCVPLNIYGANTITKEAGDFINAEGGIRARNADFDFQTIINGEPINLPAGPLGFAAGVEWRRSEGSEISNDVFKFGTNLIRLDDFGSALEQTEGFAEVIVPVLKDAPLAEYFGLELGARYTKFKPGTDAWTYKLLADWQVTDFFRLRGGLQRATRAPNFFELGAQEKEFDPLTSIQGVDPCFTGAPLAGAIRNACIATGVPVSVANTGGVYPAGLEFFYNFLGNPELSPETADTYTIGGIIQNVIPGVTFTVDYYNIDIDGVIGSLTDQFIFDKCYSSGATDNLCERIERNPTTGFVSTFTSGFDNLGRLKTDGIDFGFNYSTETSGIISPAATFNVDFTSNYMFNWIEQPLAENPDNFINCAGLYGDICGRPRNHWKSNTRFTWDEEPFAVSLNWTWIGGAKSDALIYDESYVPELARTTIGGHHYLDVVGVYRVTRNIALRGGVDNITNNKPPVVGIDQGTPASDQNTFPGQYDAIGRRYFIGAKLRF